MRSERGIEFDRRLEHASNCMGRTVCRPLSTLFIYKKVGCAMRGRSEKVK
jgi:hypothetical protein